MEKFKLYPYSKDFIKIFKTEKKRIEKAIPDAQIEHIGSTAIPGVGGKGIIDILIALKDWSKKEKAVKELKFLGFRHVHPEENKRIFLSKTAETERGDTHIHLVEKGSREYGEKLFFRDCLRKSPKEALKYQKLKLIVLKESKGERKKYGELKENYIQKILKKYKQYEQI